MYSYLMDDDHTDLTAKGTKKCRIKWEIKFEDYEDCLEINKVKLRSELRFRSEARNVLTENSTKLCSVQIMTKEYKWLMEWQHIHLAIHWKNMPNRLDMTSKNKKLNMMIKFD